MQILRLIWESLIMAVQAVTTNRLRASLSLLGITIGIFAIIAVYTIVDSLETNIRESVNSLGSDVIYIEKWPWTNEEGQEYAWWKYMNRPLSTFDEYEYISRKSKSTEHSCFLSSVGRRIEYGNNNIDRANIFGVSDGFQDIRSFELERGRYFNHVETKTGRNVVVIGSKIASELFEGADPVGKYIQLMGRKVMVIGVLEKEGKGTFDAFILDEVAILPLQFYISFVDVRREWANPQIWVQAKKNVSVEELTFEIRQILRGYRRQKPSEEDNFALNQTSLINNQLDQFFSVLKIAGSLIGIFSIIVGGFGIANIMFVSVKERTHIIGVQKALGAKKYFILLQFLFESLMLSLAGGLLGLLIVFLGAGAISLSSDFAISLTIENIMVGIVISSLIGLISGIFPAWQGARMDPVVAINTTF
ncbi:MAG: FtsX-like permease family protein [Bacteroidetes bacterium]|nr:FtsX-like permease family protein [Bacteroidota bacterium]